MRSVAAAAVVLAAGVLAQDSSCTKGLRIIVARGTGEAKGTGLSGPIANEAAGKIKDSEVVALDYPATLSDPGYNDSEGDGVEALTKDLIQYKKDCPDSKVALIGYSQGAQVTMDMLCGDAGGGLFDKATALDSNIVNDNIVAVVLFGDPSHNATAPFNKGTSTKNGLFVRSDISKCKSYADKVVSYCDTGDRYCDSGTDKLVHGSYFKKYDQDAVNYIVDHYESFKGSSGSKTTTAASGSATPSGNGTSTATQSGNGTSTATGTAVTKPTGASNSSATGTTGTTGTTKAPTASPSKDSAAGAVVVNGLYLAVPAALLALSHMLL